MRDIMKSELWNLCQDTTRCLESQICPYVRRPLSLDWIWSSSRRFGFMESMEIFWLPNAAFCIDQLAVGSRYMSMWEPTKEQTYIGWNNKFVVVIAAFHTPPQKLRAELKSLLLPKLAEWKHDRGNLWRVWVFEKSPIASRPIKWKCVE